MYLVHVGLHAPALIPSDLTALVRGHIRPEDGVEHVSVHPHALPRPVIGVYLCAPALAVAEEQARLVCERVLARCPRLAGWSLAAAEAPLLAPELILGRPLDQVSSSGPGQGGLDRSGQ